MKYLIIGLGNIGNKYVFTRHNAGFLFLDFIAQSLGIQFLYNKKFNGDISISNNLIFFKPCSFMNNAGENILKLLNYYDISKEHIVLVYDDLDIKFGEFKISKKFPRTHNGVESIILNTKYDSFINVRIGIDKREIKIEGTDYVLSKFDKEDIELLAYTIFPNIKSELQNILNFNE